MHQESKPERRQRDSSSFGVCDMLLLPAKACCSLEVTKVAIACKLASWLCLQRPQLQSLQAWHASAPSFSILGSCQKCLSLS